MDSIQKIILNSIADGVFTVDKNWHITFFNHAAEKITGISREQALGQRCCEVFKASICEGQCALRETAKTGKSIINKSIYILDVKGNKLPISISTSLLKNDRGEVIGGVESFRDLSILENLRKELKKRYEFEDIISRNHRMQQIFSILPQIAESNCTVLIQGESGTGKELIARAIHNASLRKNQPFIAVNCGALPDNLLESELFGYQSGAFTDAKKNKPGRFALAEKGTIFLDEIGDISSAMQVRLLRVIQQREYEPLGGIKTVKADVRIITASNKNLEDLVVKETFRQDLYYRINVVKIVLPPLRERKEDIPLLLEHFINKFNFIEKRNLASISEEVLSILMTHDYPGNVRELENIVEHIFVLCRQDEVKIEHLPDYLIPIKKSYSSMKTLHDMEKYIITEALQRNQGNRNAAAKELGIHKSTLFRKIKALDIHIQPFRRKK